MQAVDRAGNRSPITRVTVEIVAAPPTLAALRVAARIRVGGAPLDVAVGEGSVWVANSGSNSVSRVDPRTNAVVTTIALGPVGELAVGFGSVWVADPVNGTVRRIDPRTNSVAATIPLGLQPLDIAAGEGAVWVTSLSATTLARIDPATNVAAPVPGFAAGGLVGAVAAGRGAVWAKVGDLFKLDPTTAAVAGRVPIDAVVRSIAVDEDAVWVGLAHLSAGAPLLARVDPQTLMVQRTAAGTRCTGATGVAAGEGSVWVATGRIGVGSVPPCSLLEVDSATGQVVAELPPGEGRDLAAVAVGEGGVWAVDRVTDSLLRVARA